MKTAILTGGSSGIGLALIPHLHRLGYKVCVISRTKPAGDVCFLPCDLASSEDRAGLISKAMKELGAERLDLLLNNAGVGVVGRLEDTPLSEFERSWQVNAMAAIDLTRQAIPVLNQDATLAFVASGVALRALPFESAYCSTKAALSSFVDSLRVELQGRAHVLHFSPGPVDTGFHNAQRHFGAPVEGPHRPGRSAEEIAILLAQAIEKKKTRVLIGRNARILNWMNFFFPSVVDRLLGKMFRLSSVSKAAPTASNSETSPT